jgi:hypothetical protein
LSRHAIASLVKRGDGLNGHLDGGGLRLEGLVTGVEGRRHLAPLCGERLDLGDRCGRAASLTTTEASAGTDVV